MNVSGFPRTNHPFGDWRARARGLAVPAGERPDPSLDAQLMKRLRTTPPVPTTSIYSRTDGIVAWQACLERADCVHAENIEVDGSHCGMGWNPKVLAVIADRLRQPEGTWRRYAAAACASALEMRVP